MTNPMGAIPASRNFHAAAIVRDLGPKFAEHAVKADQSDRRVAYEALKAAGLMKAGVPARKGGGPNWSAGSVAAAAGTVPITGAAVASRNGSDAAIHFRAPMASPAATMADASRAIRALSQMIGRGRRSMERAIRVRRDRARLHAMPDHMLKDMGIPRCEILPLTNFHETDSARRLRSSGS